MLKIMMLMERQFDAFSIKKGAKVWQPILEFGI